MNSNPMQPLVVVNGVVRFKANEIVNALLRKASEHGLDLTRLSTMTFTQDDWVQFYQLIGYSLSGFHELSRVPDSVCTTGSMRAKAAGLIDARSVGGCRDQGCLIHSGVKDEAK